MLPPITCFLLLCTLQTLDHSSLDQFSSETILFGCTSEPTARQQVARRLFFFVSLPTTLNSNLVTWFLQMFKQHNVSHVVRVCDPTYSIDTLEAAGITVHVRFSSSRNSPCKCFGPEISYGMIDTQRYGEIQASIIDQLMLTKVKRRPFLHGLGCLPPGSFSHACFSCIHAFSMLNLTPLSSSR